MRRSSRKPSPPKKGTVIKLSREWTLGDQIGQGGFGRVFAASSGGTEAVVKLVPKDPGAERELLFVNLGDARNVVPIIENGEYGDFWALVMPRAEMSLRVYIDSSGDRLNLMETIAVLKDVVRCLSRPRGQCCPPRSQTAEHPSTWWSVVPRRLRHRTLCRGDHCA
jgi:eukaryotic-like serine/threonine-protein kinase